MKRIGIIAAFPGELHPLIRGWQRRGSVSRGRVGSHEAIAVCGGMGAAAVTRGSELLLAGGGLNALISVGWAGSLSCGLQPPEAVAVREVVEARTGERFATANGSGQRLITLDHVAAPPEKRQLAETFQAALVDMEAATVARIARDRGVGFFCFKAVSDGPSDKLPDFNRFIGADGQMRLPALVAGCLLHPQYWGALGRLGKNSRLAAESLARLLSQTELQI